MRNVFLNRVRREGREILEDDADSRDSAFATSATSPSSLENPEEEFFQTVLHGDVEDTIRERS